MTSLEVTAWGDIDGDGGEDVAVFIAHEDELGSYVDFRLVVLTRRTPSARFDIVEALAP